MSKPDYRKLRKQKLRQAIAFESAQMMYDGLESEYFTAKRKAAKRRKLSCKYHPGDLPSNKEIREEILKVADLHEGNGRRNKLKDMRLYALWLMKELQNFAPKLIGSTLTGHVHKNSDIDIHVFSNSTSAIAQIIKNNNLCYEIEKKRVIKYGQEREFTHIHINARFKIELTVYNRQFIPYRFKSSITGKAIERASVKELELLIKKEYHIENLDQELLQYSIEVVDYEMFKLLLLPLEHIKGKNKYHPEGDVLYHSLQVFELAKQCNGYDLEFLQAALLHDVGKYIDSHDHSIAGALALKDYISQRTYFLIKHHMDALRLKEGNLKHRKVVELKKNKYFEDLMLLREFDSKGRKRGVIVDTVDEALDYLQNLEKEVINY